MLRRGQVVMENGEVATDSGAVIYRHWAIFGELTSTTPVETR
jgi:hypothetical protein